MTSQLRTAQHGVFLSLLALAAWVAASSDSQATLLTNGDFEDGLNGWTFFGDGVGDTASLSTDTPSGAGMSADLNITTGLGLPWLTQDVPVTPGMQLTFTASVRELVPNSPDAWIAGQVWMLTSDLSTIITSDARFFTNPEWESQSLSITAPTGAAVARVLFTPQNPSFGVGTGRYLIDEVTLTVIPEPMSALLVFISGAFIACKRRRR